MPVITDLYGNSFDLGSLSTDTANLVYAYSHTIPLKRVAERLFDAAEAEVTEEELNTIIYIVESHLARFYAPIVVLELTEYLKAFKNDLNN